MITIVIAKNIHFLFFSVKSKEQSNESDVIRYNPKNKGSCSKLTKRGLSPGISTTVLIVHP